MATLILSIANVLAVSCDAEPNAKLNTQSEDLDRLLIDLLVSFNGRSFKLLDREWGPHSKPEVDKTFAIPQICSMGDRSGELAGQPSSRVMFWSANHNLFNAAV